MIAAESVTKGHPDKICDQISDAVLDEVMRNDSHPENARVACECFATTGAVVVGGEITNRLLRRYREGCEGRGEEHRLHVI